MTQRQPSSPTDSAPDSIRTAAWRAFHQLDADHDDPKRAAVSAAMFAGASMDQAEQIADAIEADHYRELEQGEADCTEPRCFVRTPRDGGSRTLCQFCIGR